MAETLRYCTVPRLAYMTYHLSVPFEASLALDAENTDKLLTGLAPPSLGLIVSEPAVSTDRLTPIPPLCTTLTIYPASTPPADGRVIV